jgi:ABC-2 type transport system ATP-binding protein
MEIVETRALTKHYGDVLAVDRLDFVVWRGSVLGLLGPNGAGKTTIIGMLLGLIRPTSGTMKLFGQQIDGATDEAVRRIGAIMETPAFYPFLSGRDNLRYFQGISGGADAGEIDRLLDLVGLTDRAGSSFSTYSLGMKHRLGIAYSLLGDPEVLLLDEPTNGLDPAGMAEVRTLIRNLGDGDRTIVLASHLLHEVEQVCDSVAILSKGRLIAQGPVGELIGGRGNLRLRTTDNAHAIAVLDGLEWVSSVRADGREVVVGTRAERAADVSRMLADAGVYLESMVGEATSLEQYFLEVTGEEERS